MHRELVCADQVAALYFDSFSCFPWCTVLVTYIKKLKDISDTCFYEVEGVLADVQDVQKVHETKGSRTVTALLVKKKFAFHFVWRIQVMNELRSKTFCQSHLGDCWAGHVCPSLTCTPENEFTQRKKNLALKETM